MRVLLDTHVLLWWMLDRSRLRASTQKLFRGEENDLLWSAASTWEMAIKTTIGKLRFEQPLPEFMTNVMASQKLTPLPIQHAHAARVAELPRLHGDPFDRLLVAQALVERVPLISGDLKFADYGIDLLRA
jgi:PIN domain nuclease of toxin-antitoxin system